MENNDLTGLIDSLTDDLALSKDDKVEILTSGDIIQTLFIKLSNALSRDKIQMFDFYWELLPKHCGKIDIITKNNRFILERTEN